jgi:hypothetical protein
MDKKERASLAWIVEQETSAMRQFKGMAVSQIDFGMLGLDIVFNDEFRLIVPDAWKVLKDGKIKFGSGNVAKVFDDPGMSLWKDEEKRVNRKLTFLKKLRCTGVNTNADELSFKFTKNIALVAHRVHEKPRFWHLQKRKGDKDFSWWGPVFEGTG